MKQIITLIVLLGMAYQVQGQQIHQLTQYMLNDYAYNPAAAGSSANFVSKFGFRKQWAGLDGGPSTGFLSVHGNLSESRAVGVGALLYSDATGPTKRTGIQLTYAYHLPIVEDETYLGFGLTGAFIQQRVNFSELMPYDTDDDQLLGADEGKMSADAHFGVNLKGPNYWAGLAINQLFGSKFDLSNRGENIVNARHLYLMGGYRFSLSEKFGLEPSLIIKSAKGASTQMELTARAIYERKYWLGLSYRTSDALALMLGLRLDNGFNFGYSYDITTSSLGKVSSGAHEISLGFDFNIRGEGAKGGISPVIEY